MHEISQLRSTAQQDTGINKEEYRLVVANQDVVTSAGQLLKRGQCAWASRDTFDMKGEPHRALYLHSLKSHVMLPEKTFKVLGDA